MATTNLLSYPAPEHVACPQCQADITFYDPEGSEFYACSSCKSFIRFNSSESRGMVQKGVDPVKEQPLIPLGSEGTLKEHTFKVIAYLERKEKGTNYSWKEYLLYNFKKGYATLAVYNGHWNFIVDKFWEPSLEKASSDTVSATHQDVEYRIFNKYTPVTTGVIGEFDWDVLSENQRTYEFIAPPFLISREGSGKAAQYFWSEYTEPGEIAEAFGLDVNLFPSKEGIGANQPSTYSQNFENLAKYTMLAIVSMLVLQLVIGIFKPETELLDSDFNITFEQGNAHTDSTGAIVSWQAGTHQFKPFLTSSFNQTNGNVPLEIVIGSDVNNNWLEATVLLVNDITNESWEVTKGIEYYHGNDGGEYWSEGSKESSIILSEIPEGKYHLNIYPVSGDPSQTHIHIRVLSNTTLWRNILLTIAILILYPAYCWYRMTHFEKRRWVTSDHSPYES